MESFLELINKIIQEKGISIFENAERCKNILNKHAEGTFKKEIRLFYQSLEINAYQELCASPNPEQTKKTLMERLKEEYMFSKEECETTISLLESIINGDSYSDESSIDQVEKAAHNGDYLAKYNAGIVFERLKDYESATYWFKKSVEECVSLLKTTRLAETSLPKTSIPVARKMEKLDTTSAKMSPSEDTPSEKHTSDKTLHHEQHPVRPRLPKNIAKNFIKIGEGNFNMGSPTSEAERDSKEFLHQVKLSAFYISKCPVTQKEYEQITKENPSNFKGENFPVENVNWFDAINYCNARSIKEGFEPVYTIKGEIVKWNWLKVGYRLPTEAEWEYACRAGTTTVFNTGNTISTDQANYDGRYPYDNNSKGTYRERTTPVGNFKPNAWGLYDMHGNVWEWCWDWFGAYDTRISDNPMGAGTGTNRIIRGGSWGGGAQYMRSANRCGNDPHNKDSYLGFRVLIPCPSPRANES